MLTSGFSQYISSQSRNTPYGYKSRQAIIREMSFRAASAQNLRHGILNKEKAFKNFSF
jgi:hypothetical protein